MRSDTYLFTYLLTYKKLVQESMSDM